MNKFRALVRRPKISIPDIAQTAVDSREMLKKVRGVMLAPNLLKQPPTYTLGQVAEVCGMEIDKLRAQLLKKPHLPQGVPQGRSRLFTLAEVSAVARALRKDYARPEEAHGVVISVGNFKGGVTKTTTTMCLAQALALKGHKVLCIDSDPQGSLSALFGILSDAEIPDEMTLGRAINEGVTGAPFTLLQAVQPTYWSGIDLIAANTALYSAEFALPAAQMRSKSFKFWDVLNQALVDLREEYDIILIDTPPALSYLTINAFMASDGLIVPLPPNNLDFASSAQFWGLFGDLSSTLMETAGLNKSFDFISVLLAKVDSNDASSSLVREWIQNCYRKMVLPVEVPKTTVTVAASTEFGTVYDIGRYEGSMKTYRRARDAYDRVADLIEEAVVVSWYQQIASVEEMDGDL